MDNYLYKIREGFEYVEYHLDSIKQWLGEDIDAHNVGLISHYYRMESLWKP